MRLNLKQIREMARKAKFTRNIQTIFSFVVIMLYFILIFMYYNHSVLLSDKQRVVVKSNPEPTLIIYNKIPRTGSTNMVSGILMS